MKFLEKLVGDKLQAERLVVALERIADTLERAYPPQLQPPQLTPQLTPQVTPRDAQEPDLFMATDESTLDFEIEDQFTWLKEKQPEMFEEIRRKLDAMEPENPPTES
jgi:hypothetical protein